MERARILLLTPRLGGGGAQQVMALLARGLPRKRFEVHLGLVRSGDLSTGNMPASVKVHPLGTGRVRTKTFSLLRLIWKLRPNVILSGAPEISFVLLFLKPFFPAKTRLLVRQNSTASAVLARGDVPRYTHLLYRLLYPRADRVICQSRAMAEDLAEEIGIPGEQIAVLPNPVDLEGIMAAQNAPSRWIGEGPHLLAAGRLAPEKGFDLLIEALVKVRMRFPGTDLTIAGSGAGKSALLALSEQANLGASFRIAESLDHPYALFPGASVFVLSSRYEGMPNALLEAAAAGLPLVATPASGGVVDLLHGQSGAWLAADVSADALADAIILALESIRPGDRFRHGFFASAAVIDGERQLTLPEAIYEYVPK